MVDETSKLCFDVSERVLDSVLLDPVEYHNVFDQPGWAQWIEATRSCTTDEEIMMLASKVLREN